MASTFAEEHKQDCRCPLQHRKGMHGWKCRSAKSLVSTRTIYIYSNHARLRNCWMTKAAQSLITYLSRCGDMLTKLIFFSIMHDDHMLVIVNTIASLSMKNWNHTLSFLRSVYWLRKNVSKTDTVIDGSKFRWSTSPIRGVWLFENDHAMPSIGSPPDNMYHANHCRIRSLVGWWEVNRCSTESRYFLKFIIP